MGVRKGRGGGRRSTPAHPPPHLRPIHPVPAPSIRRRTVPAVRRRRGERAWFGWRGELARHGAGRAAWGAAKTPHNGPPGGAQHRLVRSGRGGCPRSRSAQHRLVRAHRGPGGGPSAAPPPTPPRQRRDQRPPSSPSTPPPIVPRIVSRLVPAPPPRRPTPRRAFHLSAQDLASLAAWRRPGGGGQK